MITLYHFVPSGNCQKVRMLLDFLALDYDSIPVDVIAGTQRQSWFASLNPLQQVPLLQDADITLRDSHAILVYLASRYGPDWYDAQPQNQGIIQQWLSFSANEIAHSLQPARLIHLGHEQGDIALLTQRSNAVLQVLEQQLQRTEWLAGQSPTIADLACFPYVALSHEARIPLAPYPKVEHWTIRLRSMPGYPSMPGAPSYLP